MILNRLFKITAVSLLFFFTCSNPIQAISNPIKWQTPTVILESSDFSITINNKLFFGSKDISVQSDPGNNSYTTLEVTWYENSVEMRLNIYFYQNEGKWGISEIRTYNGNNPGDWLYYPGFVGGETGRYYQAVTKDIVSKDGSGKILFQDLKLGAFLTPPLPPISDTGYSLEPLISVDKITISDLPNTGYGVNVILKDRDRKIVTDQGEISYQWSADDSSIVSVTASALCAYGINPPCPQINGQISGLRPGETKVRVRAVKTGAATETLLAETYFPVRVISSKSDLCTKAGENIPKGTVNKECCMDLIFVKDQDPDSNFLGYCQKECLNDSACLVNERCISVNSDNQKVCRSLTEIQVDQLTKEVSSAKKEISTIQIEQTGIKALLQKILDFLAKIFGRSGIP